MDGKWLDNPTSPSEEMNQGNPKLPQYIEIMKPGDAGANTMVDVDETAKNHQDDITANGDNNAKAISKDDYGMYVEDLYYDSDKTVELPEDPNEVFIYETFIETDEEDDEDEDGASVGDTVGDDDEVV